MIYEFTEDDHYNAEREGFIKQINSFSQKWSHREFGRYDFRDGVYGEIAFAALMGIEREQHALGKLTDGGIDFLPDIDVKATAARGTWENGRSHLLRPTKYPLRAGVFVLFVLSEDRKLARFAGWASREELKRATIRTKDASGRPKVYVPTRVIPEPDLNHDWRGWE